MTHFKNFLASVNWLVLQCLKVDIDAITGSYFDAELVVVALLLHPQTLCNLITL